MKIALLIVLTGLFICMLVVLIGLAYTRWKGYGGLGSAMPRMPLPPLDKKS